VTHFQLTRGQSIALAYHLTEYPDDVAFEDILEMMEDDSNSVTIWCVFEDMNIVTLTTHIQSLSRDIDRAIAENNRSAWVSNG
jgi:hypothetical protein